MNATQWLDKISIERLQFLLRWGIVIAIAVGFYKAEFAVLKDTVKDLKLDVQAHDKDGTFYSKSEIRAINMQFSVVENRITKLELTVNQIPTMMADIRVIQTDVNRILEILKSKQP